MILVSPIVIRSIEAAQTHALRGAVLRPGASPSQLVFPGDDAPETVHFGAVGDAEIVGIASIYLEDWPHDSSLKSYRLRGMAVDARFTRQGIGKALVRRCMLHVQTQGSELLWCNARTSALHFYLALGFEIVGDEFEIADIGPHFLMRFRMRRAGI